VTTRNLESQREPPLDSVTDSQSVDREHNESTLTRAPRRVTFVISSLRAGGAERVLSRMANYWAEHGWPVATVTLESPANHFYALHRQLSASHSM